MWYTQISIFKRIFALLSQSCTSAAIEPKCGGEDARMFTEAWNSRCVMCESQPKTTLHASCYSMHACDSNAEKAANSVICTLLALQSLYKNMHYTSVRAHRSWQNASALSLCSGGSCSECMGSRLDPARQNLTEAMSVSSEQFDHLALWWEVKWFSELRAVQHICVCGKFS